MKTHIFPLILLLLIFNASQSALIQFSSKPMDTFSSISKILPFQTSTTNCQSSIFPLTNILTNIKQACVAFSSGVPIVQALKFNCPIEIMKKPKSTGQFGGFTDSFKQEMAYMIGQIINIATPEARALKDKVMKALTSINKILNIINQFPCQQDDLKPLLQKQVKSLLYYLDCIQDLLACQNSVTVIGNNNAAYANSGYINGNNNTMVGNQNTIVGNSNVVAGGKSVVAGSNNIVQGSNGVTAGKNNNVSANNSYTFANNQVVNQSNTLTIGQNTIDLVKLQNPSRTAGYLVRN